MNFSISRWNLEKAVILVDLEEEARYLQCGDIHLFHMTVFIRGITDWDFACTMPFQATERFPLFLRKEYFIDLFDDAKPELEEWRTFYTKQFAGDTAMQEYLQNIDVPIAFEDALKGCNEELSTVEDLVRDRLLESADALETNWNTLPMEESSTGIRYLVEERGFCCCNYQ